MRFEAMVMQITTMTVTLLGQSPNPQTGEVEQNLEAARMFIDQLEMLEAKTKGNLTPDEGKMLRQSLTHLRMAYVHAVENPVKQEPARPAAPTPPASAAGEAEASGKRFSKKF